MIMLKASNQSVVSTSTDLASAQNGKRNRVIPVVLVLDGNSEAVAHVRRAISVIFSVQDIWLDREQSKI